MHGALNVKFGSISFIVFFLTRAKRIIGIAVLAGTNLGGDQEAEM